MNMHLDAQVPRHSFSPASLCLCVHVIVEDVVDAEDPMAGGEEDMSSNCRVSSSTEGYCHR
jgi:hypothetical protein